MCDRGAGFPAPLFYLLTKQSPSGEDASLFCSFLCLPKETNQRKGTRPLVPPTAGCPEFMPRMGYSSMLPGVCKLGCASDSANPFFGSLSGARRRDHGENTGIPG